MQTKHQNKNYMKPSKVNKDNYLINVAPNFPEEFYFQKTTIC